VAARIRSAAESARPATSFRVDRLGPLSPTVRKFSTEEAIEDWKAYRDGQVRVLNLAFARGDKNLWEWADSTRLPPLVTETLHYHTPLADWALAAEGCDPDFRSAILTDIQDLLSDWTARYPPGKARPWDPFTVAFRTQEWVTLLWALSRQPGHPVAEKIASLAGEELLPHGLYLEQNLEVHLGGNHLLKDLCALAGLAGVHQGPVADRWLARVEEALPRELEIQILSDGGHYERSPMYHALVLCDLLYAASVLSVRSPGWVANCLSPLLPKMAAYLEGVIHPDGEVPFFNDSVIGQAPAPSEILAHPLLSEARPKSEASPVPIAIFPESGLACLRARDFTLLFDGGKLGPDELMGHVHSDSLSVEVSVGSERFLVNRGVYEYTSGTRRHQSRSIASHNTPSWDGHEKAEIWGSFRVARREHPEQIQSGENPERGAWVESAWCSEGGDYSFSLRFAPSAEIRRRVHLWPEGVLALVDRIAVRETAFIQIPFHFAPGIEVVLEGETETQGLWVRKFRARVGKENFPLLFLMSLPLSPDWEGYDWWPGFYRAESAQKVVWRGRFPSLDFATLLVREERGTDLSRCIERVVAEMNRR
jgi:hypothetical protein